eukprot:jgi/Picsp_1/2966/NSC_01190-R1_eukaryotic translation initiation factor 2d-like
MFKKNISISKTHILGGKDVKNLMKKLLKRYEARDLTQELLALLFPPKTSVTMAKLSNRSVVYLNEEGNPMFFDPSGHGDSLFPTVYALEKVPGLVESIATWSMVSSKLISGADLFLQGIVEGDGMGSFLEGSVRGVKVPGNPVPFCIGKMAVSLGQAKESGMKGKGLAVLHCYGDLLWDMGDGKDPNEGFRGNEVIEIEPLGSSCATTGVGTDSRDGDMQDPKSDAVVDELSRYTLQDSNNDNGNRDAAKMEKVDENATTSVIVEKEEDTSLRDQVMWSAALGALVKLTNKMLPLPIADFYSRYMAPLRPADFAFDFKKSKFKKLSKLLEALAQEDVVSLKQIRKETHIVSIHHDHELLKGWVPHSMLVASSKKAKVDDPAIDIALLFKPRSSLRKTVFRCEDKDALFDAEMARQALFEYCKATCSTSQSSKVSIDQFLASELFEKNKRPSESDLISMEALQTRFLNNLQPWHHLKRRLSNGNTVELLNKGEVKPMVVMAEKRQGRQITCVVGAERFGYKLSSLAEILQKRMKTACFISDLPGKGTKGQELTLAGDWLSKQGKFNLLNFFKEEGFSSEYIEVTNKLKK